MISKKTMLRHILLTLSTILLICVANSSPHPEPIKCQSNNKNCTIKNSYGAYADRSICRAAEVAYPRTEEELVTVVAKAASIRRKMKVATRTYHSTPKLVCPDGEDGLLVSTKFLTRVLEVDGQGRTMTVESGMTLKELIGEAAKVGLALPYAPYWWGLTVGGMIGTGAHGSTLLGEGSSVHDYVIGMRIVTPASPEEGYAKVRSLTTSDPDMEAAKVSLGVLGVISQVTFRLQPLFKRSISYVVKKDTDLADQVESFGLKHEFADMNWYPSQQKVVYRIDDRVANNVSGDGLYDFVGFRSALPVEIAITRATEEIQESTRDSEGKCTDGKLNTVTLEKTGYGLTNDGILFTGYPVVGYHNRLQSSGGCFESPEELQTTACPWDPLVTGGFLQQSTFSIAMSKVKSFIQDVQQLVELEPKSLCGLDLYTGILVRYVKASSAYLGKEEDAVDFEITYYRSKDPMTPRLHQDILEEIEQIGLFKYGGLPHWGKNRNVAFDGVIQKYGSASKFLKVKQRYDSLGLFSSDWTDRVLGIKDGVMIVKDGCALEGLCVCSEDNHCSPSKGYYCRPGKVYKDARVCTLLGFAQE